MHTRTTLITGLFLSLLPLAAEASFPDVPASHANFEAINYVQAQGIVKGYPDGKYKPNQRVNRAEFTKIMMEAFIDTGTVSKALQTPVSSMPFLDVPTNAWFSSYVSLAKSREIVGGYPDKTFQPEKTIVFTEAAKIIVRADGVRTEGDEIWYRPYVIELEKKQAIPLSIKGFDHTVTRGELAEMVYRLHANIETKESWTYAHLSGGAYVEEDTEVQADGRYRDYDGSVVGNGEKSVLFFYVKECVSCVAHDEKLREWYADQRLKISTYKVDFENADALRRRYSVDSPHVFVLIDGEGNAIKTLVSPTDDAVVLLLKTP